MKKFLIILLSVVLLVALAGCGSKKDATSNKLIPQKDIVEIPAPDAMMYYNGTDKKDINPGDNTYKETLEYISNQFSQSKLKSTNVDIKSQDFQDEISKGQSLLLNYKTVNKVSVNFDDGKKDLQVTGIAIVLSGKYQGYIATIEQKSMPLYEKIAISSDFLKKFK